MPKKYMYYFCPDDLHADFNTINGEGIDVSDANGKFLDFTNNLHSHVEASVPDDLVSGSYIHHRINERATLVVRVDTFDHGHATYVIEVNLPEDGLKDKELYLCPVCGSSGDHRIFPEHSHTLMSDGRVLRDPCSEPLAWGNSETNCWDCDYTGERDDFDVKNWIKAEEAMIPQK